MRRRWILPLSLVAVVASAFLLFTVPTLIHRYVDRLGATDIHDRSTLPTEINVCGRTWRLSGTASRPTPMGHVVDPLPFPPCPEGPCGTVALATACNTIVSVRVGEAEYVTYSLEGGP